MSLNPQTLMPAVVTPTSQIIVTDIDHDTFNEVIILDATLKQLSISHQFKYTDFTLEGISATVWPGQTSSIWTSDNNYHWWTAWTAPNGIVPAFPPNTMTWTISPGDTIMAADLDGDGIDELFIYNLTTTFWGVLKWEPNANQLQVIALQSVPPTQQIYWVNYVMVWTAGPGDQYSIIPNLNAIVPAVPAKAAGILAYNTLTQAMGMMSLSGTGFKQWFDLAQGSYEGSTLLGWNLGASSPPNNVFYPGCFTQAGTPTVVVYDPSDQYISLLTWMGNNFTSSKGQTTAGNWGFDQFDEFHCADLDGDGITEILMHSPSHGYVGVLKWANGQSEWQLGSQAVTKQVGTSPNIWNVGTNDKYYCMNGANGKSGLIYAFSPDSLSVGVLQYQQSSGLTCLWVGSHLSPPSGWPVTASDSFYVGPPWNTASPSLFTLSSQGSSSPVFMLGAANWNAPNLQIANSEKVPIQAWSPAFLASAPKTEFTPFVGDQAAIYTYISGQFPVPGGNNPTPVKPIRECYTNYSDKDKFQSFAVALARLSSPNPSWTDWPTVVGIIVAECNAVDTVYSMLEGMEKLASGFHKFQKGDLKTVKDNIDQSAPAPPSAFDYWAGQFFVAAIWGLAAAAGAVPAVAAFFSVAASIAGSVASALYNPTQTKSYAIADMEQEMADTFVKSIITNGVDRKKFLKDPVKLKICNGLSSNEWSVDETLTTSMEEQLSPIDRLSMYQQLLPSYFVIAIWQKGFGMPTQFTYQLNNTYFSLLLNGHTFVTPDELKTWPMFIDLFTKLNVSQEDFFVGTGAWANIPRSGTP